jgi:hypothetical protein
MRRQKGIGAVMNGSSTTSKRTRWAIRIGYAACSWALLFALVHLYWGGVLFCALAWLARRDLSEGLS